MIKRYIILLILFFTIASSASVKSLNIEKIYTKSSTNDVSICARLDRYFDVTNSNLVKPYIKVTPQQYFKIRLSYDEICIKGLKPQTKYTITIDKSIPLGKLGLDKTYTFTKKTGSYDPSFSFKGGGYILPAKGDISIPVETTNVKKLEVSLYRINRNNLIGAVNRYGLIKEIESYNLDDIKNQNGYFLWSKVLPIRNYKENIAKVTAIPVGKYIKKLEPGVYILAATTFNSDGTVNSWKTTTQWFMVSDIGLFTMQGDKGMHIYSKHLSNASKYNNVKLELVSKNNEVLAKAVTKDGYAFFKSALLNGKLGLAPKAIYAYGENGDFTVLNLSQSPLDLTDRGVAGREAPEGYDGFIFSNRGIFRPGESVAYNLLVRDSYGKVAKDLKLIVKIVDSRGVELKSKTVTTDELGHIGGEFKIPKSGETGRYIIFAYAGDENEIANLNFLVEDFVPPKIEVIVTDKPKELKPNSNNLVKAVAKYLTGDNMPMPSGDFKVILHASKTPFKEFKGYQFGRVEDTFSNDYALEDSFTGDKNGTIELPLKLKTPAKTTLPVSAYVKISVNEPGGRPVENGFNIFYNDKYGYIGIKPNFKYDAVDLNQKPSFNVVYIRNSKAVSAKVHYRVVEEEREWNWSYDNESDTWDYYVTYSDNYEVSKGDLNLQARPTPLAINRLDWGSYRIEISDDRGIVSSYRFSVGYEELSSKASPDRLPIAINKKVYQPNDTLKVNITPKFSGPLIVNIANNRIIKSKELQAKEGVPLKVEFKIKPEWGSSVYVLASEFRAQDKKRGASRAIGVAHIAVHDANKYIELKVNAPKKIESNSKLRVTLNAAKLEDKAYAIVAVVDKGVLNMTKYKTPNPAKYFWGQKKLGIKIRDVYSDLIKVTGEHGEFDVGADGELQENLNEDVTTNKREVVALISKPLMFKDGKAVAEFDIPAFQGSLKVMAVAWSKKGVGSSDAITIVKDPISLEAYMPRFLANGDIADITLSAKFDNEVIKPGKYILKVDTSGGVKAEQNSIEFNYDGKSNFLKAVPIRATKLEDGNITLSVYKNGKRLASREFGLSVRSPYPQTFARRVKILDKGLSLDAKDLINKENWQNISKLRLRVSSSPLIDKKSIEDELTHYCCRCAEQTTSRAFPYVDRKDEYSKDRVNSAIERLLNLQKIDGSFGLWYESKASTWVSAYVLDFLTRAKANGYNVPNKNINEGLKWLQNSLYKWSQKQDKQEADAYALYVLARNSKVLMSDIMHHVNDTHSLIKSGFAWGHLATTLAILGEKQKAKELFAVAQKSLGVSDNYSNFGGVLRDKAALIVLAKEAKFDNIAQSLYADLALDLKDKKYLSTQEMSQILRAVNVMHIKPSKLSIMVNNKPYNSTKEFVVDAKSLDKIPTITNRGKGSIWYNLSFVGTANPASYHSTYNKGFSIYKTIYSIDGKKLNPAQIAKNRRVVVVVSGKVEDSAIKRPLIIDFLPSGFELENPDISGIDELSALKWLKDRSALEHAAYRDDRYAAAINLEGKTEFKVAYIARAVTLGKFAYPPALIEDMYKPRYRALSKLSTKEIEIKNAGDITVTPAPSDSNTTKPSAPSELTSSDYLSLMSHGVGDLSSYNVVELNRLRNGIFAQAGLDFSKTNPALYKLFSKFDWYKPTTSSGSVVYANLTPLQKKNVLALLNEEKKRCGGRLTLSDFYRVKVRQLSEDDLKKYNKEDLKILRNSLIARYGLTFKDDKLRKIYSNMPWYKPNPNITASEIIDKQMSDLERANIQTILRVEQKN